MARKGLLNRHDTGFIGLVASNGSFIADAHGAIDQRRGLHCNTVFDREPSMDFAPSDFDAATKHFNLKRCISMPPII